MESHIFPEWLYKPLYDDSHQFSVLSTDENKRRGTRRKGIYEKLLCRECELHVSKWEGYARDVFYSRSLKFIEKNRALVFSGLEYTSFKLFQMSLIWRASITSRPEIHRIDLGHHAEIIRVMLLDNCPGEVHEYGSILMFPPLDQEIMEQLIYPPEVLPKKFNGHSAYRAIFGGLFWLFIVSGHSDRLPYKEVFLSKDGRLSIFKAGNPAVKFMEQLTSDFLKDRLDGFMW